MLPKAHEAEQHMLTNEEINNMDSSIKPAENYPPVMPKTMYQGDMIIALQSALAAGLCLGLPAGIIFWLIIVQRWAPSTPINSLVNFFSDNLVPPVILEMLGAFGWGLCLSKISG